MSIQSYLENVNEGNVFVCFCLFWWIVLVALQADKLIILPYWAVFIPLWFWKVVVFLGWLIGVIVWLRQRRSLHNIPNSPYLFEDPAVPHIQAMSVSLFFTLLLCCSEVLLCLHLSYPHLNLAYLTILTPLLLVGALGILGFLFVMVDCRSFFAWTHQNRRRRMFAARAAVGDHLPDDVEFAFSSPPTRRVCSFTMELYVAANMLQIIFLIARLDKWIRSKWVITFIPTFILLGMGLLFCTVGFIVALVRYFTAFFIPVYQRQVPIRYYASHILINILLCTSVAFLALRLDNYLLSHQISYSLICTPVLLSLVLYAVNSFYLGPGNPWWFGLNRNILLTLFHTFPALQLCANTSVGNPSAFWKLPSTSRRVEHGSPAHSTDLIDRVTESSSDYNSRSAIENSAIDAVRQESQAGPSSFQEDTESYKQSPLGGYANSSLPSKRSASSNKVDAFPTESVVYPD